MGEHSDKREFQREKSFIVCYIQREKAYVTDISEKGCQVFIEDKKSNLNIGDILVLEIELPEYQGNKPLYLEVEGTIAWKRRLEDFALLGLHFDTMGQKNENKIKRMVHYWNFLNTSFGYLNQ
jgi:c-di-GMP-binding flagellar brake protein YcgR